MKKILVTGSEGYIGTVLVEVLLKKGYRVDGIDICYFSNGNLDKSKRMNYNLISKDLRDINLSDIDNGYDAIIHLAALSNDPLGMLNEQLTFDINYHESVRLATLAKKAKISRFIYSSSCSLYGQGGSLALTEESESNPQTAYGKSKILAEQGIAKLADENFSPVYMRNATAYGFSPRMRFDLVVNSLSGYAMTDNEIKILGDGKPWRPIVHIRDIIGAMLAAVESSREVIHNQAFNVGDGNENYQILTIAKEVSNFFPGCAITIAKKDAGDTRDYNVSFSKLNNILKYKCEWTLRQGIEELYNVFQDISLDKVEFENSNYTRLKEIERLLKMNLIDNALRRT